MAICYRRDFENCSFDWKLKEPVPFLIVKNDSTETNHPPTPTISSNTANKYFDIAILFNRTERSGNYVFEDGNPPQPLGQGL